MRVFLSYVFLFIIIESSFALSSYNLAALVSDPEPEYHTALQLAIETVNNSTEILENILLSLDKQAGDTEAFEIAAMLDFDAKNQTFVVGNEFSFLSVVTGIVGNVYGIAQLSSSATSSTLSDTQKFPFYSRLSPPSFGQAFIIQEALLYYEKQQGEGWTDVAIVSTTDEFGIDSAQIFIENAADNFEVRTFQQYIPGETQFDVELREIQKSGARVIIAFLIDQYEAFIVAADTYDLVGENYVWLVPDSVVGVAFEDPEAAKLSRGVLGSFQFIPDSGDAYEKYVDRWISLDPIAYPGAGPGKIPGPYSLLGYDTIIAAALAIEMVDNQGLLDQERVPAEVWFEAVKQVKFAGVTGSVSFDSVGDRKSTFSLSYYNPDSDLWILSSLWSEEEGFEVQENVFWFSNTTEVPDLDIRPPFDYWSCHDKEERTDPTGKEISRHTPDGSNIDEISSHYHCDGFIDCKNLSDESSDCANNYVILFIVFGVITGLLILICLFLFMFVILFGFILKFRKLRACSPFFLSILLISIIIGYSSVFAWFGKPHPVSCAFQPWLLGIPAISMVSTLCVKSFRIWKIFKDMKKHKITDLNLLVMWCALVGPAVLIIALWTIISTPTATIEERDGEEHYVCTTGGFTGKPLGYVFFALLVAEGSLVLFFGIFLSIVTRKVPSMFNESKLLAISIYNLAFLTVVIIPVFLVVNPFNPFLAWILRTIAILYAFTATLILQFAPSVISIVFIDRFQNIKVFKSTLSGESFASVSVKNSNSMVH